LVSHDVGQMYPSQLINPCLQQLNRL
jgi:hypothetical protein